MVSDHRLPFYKKKIYICRFCSSRWCRREEMPPLEGASHSHSKNKEQKTCFKKQLFGCFALFLTALPLVLWSCLAGVFATLPPHVKRKYCRAYALRKSEGEEGWS